MKIVKTIFFVLFALMFINAGLDKFLHYMPMPEMTPEMKPVFEAFGTLSWLTPLTGLIELLAGILILFPKTRALGAIMILPVMIGILCHNATFMPSGLLIAGVLFLINFWMIGDNWKKYQAMVS
ncbi:DoxX family membrane protein [Niabella sp. CJ426]|uniref:DoxX family membrane protein n=1 Tax=Niabella sp. CJ426 TaxID=3393740 RepID=UPI003CFFB83C